METTFLSTFLPDGLLNQFDLKEVKELGLVKSKKVNFYFYLEERNTLPSCYSSSEYESKGFFKEKLIQDFPIRGKAVYLVIKRRRWRHKKSGEEISSDCSFITDGSKLTKELSDFLKGAGRDPGTYHDDHS
jgi:transposase